MRISCFEEGTILDEIEIDFYVPMSLEFPINDSRKKNYSTLDLSIENHHL